MSAPRLSVVVPTRDTRELTARCLASLDRLGEHELVLVDDGSTDGTTDALCPRYPEAIWLRSETSGGFTRAANQGLASASGQLLLLLNSDTEILAGAGAALAARFAADEKLGAAGALLCYPDGAPQWSGGPEPTPRWLFALSSGLGALAPRFPGYRKLRPVSGTSGGAAATPVDWVPGTAMLLRREAWQACGPFDDSYRFYAQDLDLATRLRMAGWRLAVIPELRVLHHLGATVDRLERGHQGQRLDWLYRDLLSWGERHRGQRWAKRARRALVRGARLRAAALALEGLTAGRERRARIALERRALASARAALAASVEAPAPPLS